MIEIFENIRKIYTFKAPCEELRDFIEFYSESSLEKTQLYIGETRFSVKMFASWTPTFYINLGQDYTIALGDTGYPVRAGEDILVLRNNIVERNNNPADNIFTVKFYPGGLEAVLGVNQVSFRSRIIDLGLILPPLLLTRLKHPLTFDKRAEMMEQYLLRAFKKKTGMDYYLKIIQDSIGAYQEQEMHSSTTQLAEKMFLTSKTINRYFHRVVGTAPKSYFSILRARTALTQYLKAPRQFDPFAYGYYDRSHFYRDMVKFTGSKLTTSPQ